MLTLQAERTPWSAALCDIKVALDKVPEYICTYILHSSLWVSRTGSDYDWCTCALQEALYKCIYIHYNTIYIHKHKQTHKLYYYNCHYYYFYSLIYTHIVTHVYIHKQKQTHPL